MSEAITRCPKCHTSFKLKKEHLNSARGAVRCGSCLTIFNANENLVEDSTQPKSKAKPEKKPVKTKAKKHTPKNRNQADESWAQQLLEEEDDKDEIIDDDPDETDEQHAEPKLKIPTDTDPVFKIIEDELEHEKQQVDDDINEALIRERIFEEEYQEAEAEPHFESNFDEEPFENEPSPEPFLHAFEAEPLEFTGPKNQPFWQSNIFWASLSALLALLAAIQLFGFNIDRWGRNATLRPYYASACEFLPCSLPTLVATDKIRIENMVVQNHPEKGGALLIDATIVNEAEFEQPFPSLLLSFSDPQAKPVDQFQFSPKDYVGGELAGNKNMPAQHPIHITLEVPDPGPQAVNYHFSIVKK